MIEHLALRVLSRIMDWDDEEANTEFAWLRMMARLKFDGYRDFQAGMRFIESLATWLQQFSQSDRRVAYNFLRHKLIYISPLEKRRLAEQFYSQVVFDRITRIVANKLSIPRYLVLSNSAARSAVKKLQRETLVMGLSDGARLDIVRHANVGRLSNEQVVPTTQIDAGKWQDLLSELRAESNDPKALFSLVCLVDDFTASGTSFLRFNSAKQKWTGKIVRFEESLRNAVEQNQGLPVLSEDWHLSIHHYISSAKADATINDSLAKAASAFKGVNWASKTTITYGHLFSEQVCINPKTDPEIVQLTQDYYNDSIQTKHTDKGGVKHLGLGYAGCALPVVLEHNTPNNSLALLWAETQDTNKSGTVAHAMQPLFRRRQRHI